MNQLTALDPQVLETLRMLTEEGEPDVLAEVLVLFREDAPTRVAGIVAALRRGDPEAAKAAAHYLKGAAGNIGAYALHTVCRDIEVAASAGDLSASATLIDELTRQADRVERDIAYVLQAS